MIDLNQILTVIKKQGATGVLAIWLYYTHSEVQDLKLRLYDCYGKTEQVIQKEIPNEISYAIIPEDYIAKSIKRKRA